MRGGGGAKLPGLGLVSTLLRSESPVFTGQAPVDTPILYNTHENTGTSVTSITTGCSFRTEENIHRAFITQRKKEEFFLYLDFIKVL